MKLMLFLLLTFSTTPALPQQQWQEPDIDKGSDIPPAYALASIGLTGLNIYISGTNIKELKSGRKNENAVIAGLLIGGLQVTTGILSMPKEEYNSLEHEYTVNQTKKFVSISNIAVGSTTMILSIINLSIKREKSDNKLSICPVVFDTPVKESAYGLYLSYRIE